MADGLYHILRQSYIDGEDTIAVFHKKGNMKEWFRAWAESFGEAQMVSLTHSQPPAPFIQFVNGVKLVCVTADSFESIRGQRFGIAVVDERIASRRVLDLIQSRCNNPIQRHKFV